MRSTLPYFYQFDYENMDARLLAYYKSQVAGNSQLLWSLPYTVDDNAFTIHLDPRVTSAFTAGEATTNAAYAGESTSCGVGAVFGHCFGELLLSQSSWIGQAIGFQNGVVSQTVAEMAARYAGQVFPLRPQGDVTTAHLFVDIGIKDTGSGRPAVDTWADIEAYCDTADGDGFTVHILNKWPNMETFDAGMKTQMDALNALIMGSGLGIDVATALGLPPASGSNTNFQDPVHQSAAGALLEAQTINAALSP